jgi:hypothetical protein
MREIADLRCLAIGKFEYWLEDASSMIASVSKESMRHVARTATVNPKPPIP